MADLQISPHLDKDKDEDNKPLTPETQVPDTALSRLLAINKDFTQLHAAQTISEIKILWPDLRKTDFATYELYNLAQVLRQGKVLVEQRCLRAFLVAWKVLDVNFPSLDVTGQAKLIRDMVVRQLGPVEKEVIAAEDQKLVTTPRTKTNAGVKKEFIQAPSPGSSFKLLFKTQKKWARQRQLKTLISQTKKPEKRKRDEDSEHNDTAAELDDDQSELNMEPIALSAAEKEALTLQKLERKRRLEALGSKQKRHRYH